MMSKVSKAYQSSTTSALTNQAKISIGIFLTICSLLLIEKFSNGSVSQAMTSRFFGSQVGGKHIRAITWNVAAINNNPFEYWITNKDPAYNNMMRNVSNFVETPGAADVQVKDIVTDAMVKELMMEMAKVGIKGLNETLKVWESDFRKRKIISEFIRDGTLGKKRLASMPDRVTNTINTVDEGVVTRPTVINCYSGDLGSIPIWWKKWKDFMFRKSVVIKKKDKEERIRVIDMLTPIKRSKYPAVTEAEEKINIPLQVLSAAIFDAILIHMMNTIAPQTWQPIRETMCNNLNRKKHEITMNILETTYSDAKIQFLQEVASSFKASAQNRKLSEIYDIYSPEDMDTDRDQNSFILLKKHMFSDIQEVTSEVLAILKAQPGKTAAPVANGDLLVLIAVDASDPSVKYLLASFHGDTNGLATIPIVSAVHSYATSQRPDHKLLFGMDANTYAHPDADQQGVVDFAKFYVANKLNTCYGPTPNPLNFTTFHARTHLQPQLNKAVSLEEKDVKGDKNPKDFIMFFAADFQVLSTRKDNTGQRHYIENMVFPTLTFPSDHGITAAVLLEVDGSSSTSSTSSSTSTNTGTTETGTLTGGEGGVLSGAGGTNLRENVKPKL